MHTTPDTQNPLGSVKKMEGAELYAVMGWCGITDPMMIPDTWKSLYSSDTFLTERGDLYKRMQGWSVDNDIPTNKMIRFSKQWFLDLMGMELAMGEACASWPSLERGMSAQNCLPITVEHIARANDHERAEDKTSATRTLNESLNLKKLDPKPPPRTLEALELSVAAFAALLWALFGNHCDLYRKVKSYRETLDTPAVDFKLHCYTPHI